MKKKVIGRFRSAFEHSSFYRRKFRTAGLDKESINSLSVFCERVPLTTPEEINARREWKESCEKSRSQYGPVTMLQLETKDSPVPIFAYLTGRDLQTYAKALSMCWKSWGVQRHDIVEICDYGNSPAAYLASRYFVPHLRSGASERLGALAVCNDGLPEFVARGVFVANVMNPRVLVIREDLLPLLSSCLRANGSASSLRELGVERLVVTSPCTSERVPKGLVHFGVDTYKLLRCDQALFLSTDCRKHEGFHVSQDLYFPEIVDPESGEQISSGHGRLAITNLFSEGSPMIRYLTDISGSIVSGDHGCGQLGARIILENG